MLLSELLVEHHTSYSLIFLKKNIDTIRREILDEDILITFGGS